MSKENKIINPIYNITDAYLTLRHFYIGKSYSRACVHRITLYKRHGMRVALKKLKINVP
jgi:hypothetical protein